MRSLPFLVYILVLQTVFMHSKCYTRKKYRQPDQIKTCRDCAAWNGWCASPHRYFCALRRRRLNKSANERSRSMNEFPRWWGTLASGLSISSSGSRARGGGNDSWYLSPSLCSMLAFSSSTQFLGSRAISIIRRATWERDSTARHLPGDDCGRSGQSWWILS